VIALVCVLAVSLAGQAGPDHAPGAPDGAAATRAPRDEAFKMIDAYVLSNLQESLELTDDQFARLMPLVKRLQTDRRAMVLRRNQPLMELRRLLASGGATEPRVRELLAQIKSAETDEPALLRKDRDAIDAALSPIQQAKFRVMELEVEHKIRELMTQVRQQQRRGGPARRREDPPPSP